MGVISGSLYEEVQGTTPGAIGIIDLPCLEVNISDRQKGGLAA